MATSATTRLRFRLLGPLEVLRDGEPLQLGGERQRGLLALLLLNSNELVTTDQLAEQLFGAEASAASIRAVRVAVSRLRRILDDDTLATRPGGYLLHVDAEQLDVAEFEAIVAQGRAALNNGDPVAAAAAFSGALALFRGPPLADLGLLDFVQPEARRLEELRLSAQMDRIDADLALGCDNELVPELETLVRTNPFQERLRGQLMLALYRSGRQTDALEVYRCTRDLLADELGLEPSRALQQLERAMLQHDPALDDTQPTAAREEAATCPFKGLAAFEAADAFYFCGRERLLDEIVTRLAFSSFLGIVGPSGVGKSSLLRAGVLPALANGALPGSATWPVVLVRGGERATTIVRDAVGACAVGDRVVIAVDQLEEIFADDVPADERVAFFSELEGAADDPANRALVLVAVRADFYGRFADHSGIADRLSQSHVFARSLDREELARAIEVPASRAGLDIEPALVDALVAETTGVAGALPLLQTTLLQLWAARDGRALRYESYRAIGGLRGAVARLAEETFTKLSTEDQELTRRIMLRLAGGEDGALVRRRVPLADLQRLDGAARVVDALVAARLLTVDDELAELSHEALLQEWPRYAQWLEDDRVGRHVRVHLTASADEWRSRGRDSADLYRGARLTAALEIPAVELSELEREFLDASRAEAERELNQQRAHNRRLRMLLAGVGILLVAAVVAGVLALVSRSNAKHEAQVALGRQLGAEAVSEPRIDLAMLLARESLNLNDSPQTEGTLLSTLLRSPSAVATFSSPITDRPQRLALSPDGRTLEVVENTNFARFYDTKTHRQRRRAVPNALHLPAAYSKDGKLLVLLRAKSANGAPFLEVRDGRTLRHRAWLPLDQGWLNSSTSFFQPLIVGPDDRTAYLVYSTVDPQTQADLPTHVDMWDLRSGKLTRSVTLPAKGAFDSHLGSDGNLWVLADGRVLSLDRQSLKPVESRHVQLPGSSATDTAVLSPDGSTIMIGQPSGAVSFVDVRTGLPTVATGKTSAAVQSVAFSPGGRVAVSTDENGHVTIWNPKTGDLVETFTGHEDRTFGSVFTADGRTLYTCSLDGAIFAWDLSGKHRFGRSFVVPSAGVEQLVAAPLPPLALSGDGTSFATRTQLGRVGLYSTSTLREERSLTVEKSRKVALTSIDWSPTKPELAVADTEGRVALWRVGTQPHLVRTLKGLPRPTKLPEAANVVVFSPDGSRVAAVGVNHTVGNRPPIGTVAVWRASDGKLLWSTAHRQGPADAVAFSRDGRLAVSFEDWVANTGVDPIYDAATGKLEQTVHPIGASQSFAFAPDGTLATGAWSGIVQRWTRTGKQIGHPVLTLPAPVASMAFTKRGDELVTGGGSGGFVKLWDAKTMQEIGSPLPGSPGKWANVVFFDGGTKLLTLYDDGRGAVWPMTLAAWEAHACQVAGRNFTHEEWRRFVGARSYSTVCPPSR